jgi:hypothetical protein
VGHLGALGDVHRLGEVEVQEVDHQEEGEVDQQQVEEREREPQDHRLIGWGTLSGHL